MTSEPYNNQEYTQIKQLLWNQNSTLQNTSLANGDYLILFPENKGTRIFSTQRAPKLLEARNMTRAQEQ